MTEEHDDEESKTYNPNLWGLGTGIFGLVAFTISYIFFGWPDTLIHVLILPVIVGLLVRWQIKLSYGNPYRDD
jgi:hypothetical protein